MAKGRGHTPNQGGGFGKSAQVQAKFSQAFLLHEKGQFERAETLYKSVIKIQPRHFDSLQLLGYLAFQTGRHELAIKLISQAIAINPNFASTYCNIGLALQALGRFDEALANYDKAIALQINFFEAHNNRGNVLKDLKRYDDALLAFEKAIALQPNFAEAANNLGVVLMEFRRIDEAIGCYRKAIALKPDYAEAYQNCGNALTITRQFDSALRCYDRAIELRPNYAKAYQSRGNLLRDLNRIDEALASYAKALALHPDYEFLPGTFLLAKMQICDWQDFAKNIAEYAESLSQRKKVTLPFPALSLLDAPELHQRAAEIWVETMYPPSKKLGAIPVYEKHEKIRIGYYSADFHNHATCYLMAQLFEAHDRNRFEIYGFSFGPNIQDEMRTRVSAAFDHFFDVAAKSDIDIARQSRELGIDIAVDLKGFTTDSRMGIFAARSAPLQVSYLGYPGTTGAPYMDYVIADERVIPREQMANYAEKIIYLPHSYQVNDSTRRISERVFTREEVGLPADSFVFCCFNNTYKILPSTFDVWMRLLQSVAGSVLWLLEDGDAAVQNLHRAAADRGVASERLVFAKRMPLDEHLARHRLANLFIDTLPYNAHTTASDALWAGLPVLTLAGKSFAGRVAASLLHAVDLPEMVTHSEAEYVEKAIGLASEPKRLRKLKEKLTGNLETAPLFDIKLFSKHIEAAYVAMYERYQAGCEPEHIQVS